jgi:hypothetical protein
MADSKDIAITGSKTIKKTGRGGKDNFPSTIPSGTKKEDVQRIMGNLLNWYNLDKVRDDDELQERIAYFFKECFERGEIPTWEKLCLAIGYSRSTVWDWLNGIINVSSRRLDIIKKAKEFLASFDAEMATEGKINPVTYIFRAKNYFGMADKQEMVLTPNNPLGDNTDPDELQRRYSLSVGDDE